MAENTSKVYPKGAWYGDSPLKRYERVMTVLERYDAGEYDRSDVNWFIKNAILSRVYISQAVYNRMLNNTAWDKPNNKRLKVILQEIYTNGYASDKAIDIRKRFGGGLRFEHVIPFQVVFDHIWDLYTHKMLTFDKFQEIRQMLYVCIVTVDEEKNLSGKYRQKMPIGWGWRGNPFARYAKTSVKVFGRLV